ncbi:unnamed protein product, partial [Effrenium voratum]
MRYDVSTCQRACTTAESVDVTLGSTTSVNPSSKLVSGSTEYSRACSGLHSGYEGSFSVTCTAGVLSADLSACSERGCLASDTVSVTVGSSTDTIVTGEALAHGGSIQQVCEDVDAKYTGTLTINCALGEVSLSDNSCSAKPCEPWDFVAATLQGASGLLYPKAQIVSGSTGVGECGDVNVEWSGDFVLNCNMGVLEAGDSSACRQTCSSVSSTTVTIDGTGYSVTPAARIAHDADGSQ